MSDLHVIFQVAGADYAVPASDVQQLESFAGATPVPGAPPFVLGLAQVRGQVVPVVDLRRRFGQPPADPGPDSRLIVVRRGERTVALLADRSREVVRLASEDLLPPPEILHGDHGSPIRSVARTGDRLLLLIDFDGIVDEVQT